MTAHLERHGIQRLHHAVLEALQDSEPVWAQLALVQHVLHLPASQVDKQEGLRELNALSTSMRELTAPSTSMKELQAPSTGIRDRASTKHGHEGPCKHQAWA